MFNERTNENANELNTTRQYSISKAGLFAKTLVGLVHVDDMLTSFVKNASTTIGKFLIPIYSLLRTFYLNDPYFSFQ